jgi:type I restriction enzyme S subunit
LSERNAQRLPEGWVIASLPEIAAINPATARLTGDDATPVNFVPMRAVEPEGGGLANPEVRPYGEVKKGYTSFLSGDVIMAKITPCMENGKTTAVPDLPGKLCFGSTEFHVIRAEDGVQPKWISNFLLQHEVRRVAQRQMTGGVGQMRVPASFLQGLQIPVAPIAEQQRISDALDELLSDLDAGVEALQRAQAKLSLYRASVLKAAVQGDLTAEWRKRHPDAEPAPGLLQRILLERRQRWEQEQLRKFKAAGKTPPGNWKTKYKEPVAPDTTKLPPIPEGWCWASFGQIAWLIRSGVSATSGRQATNHPVLKSSAVRPNSIDFEDVNFLPDSESASGEHFLQLRDLLITRLSGSLSYVANCAVVQKLPNIQMQYPDRIFCAKVIDSIDPQFISACFQHQSFRKHFENAAKSTAGHQRISLTDLVGFLFPLPPLAEQFSIIEMLDENLSGVDHLLIEARQREESLNALRQSILRHAFTGQLIPQDPKDEPASELLKRIAAEREARKKIKATPRKQTAKRQKREK